MSVSSKVGNWLFLTCFALLITHEIDAAFRMEWRVLPLVRALPEDAGRLVFIVAHVPLIMGLIYACWEAGERARALARNGVAVFCVIHAGLHVFFSDHAEYRFHGLGSHALIQGAALAGLIYLVVSSRKT